MEIFIRDPDPESHIDIAQNFIQIHQTNKLVIVNVFMFKFNFIIDFVITACTVVQAVI